VSASYTIPPSIEDLKALLIVSDNVDNLGVGDIQVILDTYSDRQTQIGTFEVTFLVSDGSGNTASHSMIITIVDDQLPIIFVDDYIIQLHPDVTFSRTDALLLMLEHNLLEEGNYEIEVLIDEYSGHEDTKGMYLYQVQFTDELGQEVIKDFVIQVTEDVEQNYYDVYASIALLVSFGVFIIIKKRK
jgi:hypothetical protein